MGREWLEGQEDAAQEETHWWNSRVVLTRGLRSDNRQFAAPSEEWEATESYRNPIQQLGTAQAAVELSAFQLMLLTNNFVAIVNKKDPRHAVVSRYFPSVFETKALCEKHLIACKGLKRGDELFDAVLPEWAGRLYWFLLGVCFEHKSQDSWVSEKGLEFKPTERKSVLLRLDWVSPLCQALGLTGNQFWTGLDLLSAVGAVQWHNPIGVHRRKAPAKGSAAQVYICVQKEPVDEDIFRANGRLSRLQGKGVLPVQAVNLASWATIRAHRNQEQVLCSQNPELKGSDWSLSALNQLESCNLRVVSNWEGKRRGERARFEPGAVVACTKSSLVYKKSEWARPDEVSYRTRRCADGSSKRERRVKSYHAGMGHFEVSRYVRAFDAKGGCELGETAGLMPLQAIELGSFGRKALVNNKVVMLKEVSGGQLSLLALLSATADLRGKTPRMAQSVITRGWPGGAQAVRSAARKLTGLGFLVPIKAALKAQVSAKGITVGYITEASCYQIGSWNPKHLELLVCQQEGYEPARVCESFPERVSAEEAIEPKEGGEPAACEKGLGRTKRRPTARMLANKRSALILSSRELPVHLQKVKPVKKKKKVESGAPTPLMQEELSLCL